MDESLKLSNQLCFPIYNLSKEIVALYRPILENLDLTYPQYLVMLVLWEHNGLNVSEIGHFLNLDSGTLTPLLKRLEGKKIIDRKRSEVDERVVQISLTDLGRDLEQKALCIPTQLLEKVNISADELNQLQSIISKIIKTI